ncbi:MAG: hypothetical protein KGH61_03695 [Candidatus Micrarchaeota archaeon]|nr:hypothetical protein [Candidatus Micrarchaeota archaeon]MDE1848025.1 hypothetical protein [Candidatus Micrarchaeota archaeon]MDE1864598.1 hypothetical protein [Candidatus Micrarchaeota archaeon]
MEFKGIGIRPNFENYALESRFSKVSVACGEEGMRFVMRDKINGKDYEIKFRIRSYGENTGYAFGILTPVFSDYGTFDNGPKKIEPIFYAKDKITAYICALELAGSILKEKRKVFGDFQVLRDSGAITSLFERLDLCLEAYERFKFDITNMSEVHAD